MKRTRLAAVCAATLSATSLASCTTNGPGTGAAGTITVTSTAEECGLSATKAPSGRLTFKVSNQGVQVTEFYLYDKRGTTIVGEVENIGPGLTRNLVVTAAPGRYQTACKPGMSGRGIRDAFTVTDSGRDTTAVRGVDPALVHRATDRYAEYVRTESTRLLAQTRAFVTAYDRGENTRARHRYPRARVHWERIEPVAESFGDLDPRMDLREADLAQGQRWTGWHRLEKDLWPPHGYTALDPAQRRRLADRLLSDTVALHRRVRRLDFTVDQIGNGAKELMDEIATGKVTGEEEAWSHTDLVDFQANLDGAREAFRVLREPLRAKDAALAHQLQQRFARVQHLLAQYRTHDGGYASYTTLSTAQVKGLSDAVNALSEPLARLTASVAL